jgi:DNA repair exonuclease SbcCD ATPase subunit
VRRISLQSVDMTNFKSFVSGHVDLRRGAGLRMVFGENHREPRLGANGAGKSTIFDAVEFCASGRSVRGRRASELVTTGQKSMAVETTYLIDDVEHQIRRTYAPERVYIDGEVAEQRQVDELIGLSRERRLASVLFGQARPLFMDMPAPERGDLLDQVLGLEFWMRAADLATQRWNKAGVEVQAIQRDLARLEGALEELSDEAELKRLAEEHDARREEEITELRDQRKVLDAEYRRLRRAAVAMGDTAGALDEAVTVRDALREEQTAISAELAVLRSDFDRLSKDIAFFEDNNECPTCGQEIDGVASDEHLVTLRSEVDEKSARLAEVIAAKNALEERVRLSSLTISTRQDEARARRIADGAVVNKKGEISVVDNRITLVQDQPNPYREQAASAAERRAALEKQVEARRAEEVTLSSRMGDLDFWRQGFRRVRIFCLSRVLKELEVETMSAARSLGLVGWHVGFTGETETKSGTVKLGVRAVVESPEAKRDFDAWSPGEGQRIRCASALGLASLIQRYSGVVYDLEVWDEPSAWLSEEGIEDLFACLSERAHSRGKSIWVCDPRAGIAHGVFDEIWNVIKNDDGSRVEIVRPDRLAS